MRELRQRISKTLALVPFAGEHADRVKEMASIAANEGMSEAAADKLCEEIRDTWQMLAAIPVFREAVARAKQAAGDAARFGWCEACGGSGWRIADALIEHREHGERPRCRILSPGEAQSFYWKRLPANQFLASGAYPCDRCAHGDAIAGSSQESAKSRERVARVI